MTQEVIDRLRYDDATATQIATFNNGQPPNSPGRRSERLFKTPNGRYFLVVRRQRAQHNPQGPNPRRFVTLTRREAIRWLRGNAFTTELNAEFAVADA